MVLYSVGLRCADFTFAAGWHLAGCQRLVVFANNRYTHVVQNLDAVDELAFQCGGIYSQLRVQLDSGVLEVGAWRSLIGCLGEHTLLRIANGCTGIGSCGSVRYAV